MPPTPRKKNICGTEVSATTYSEVAGLCSGWIREKRSGRDRITSRIICVTSVHGIVTALEDPELQFVLNQADIATPDGMPVVWALRSFGEAGQQRVYGPTLMLRLCEQAAAEGHRIFLYGSTDDTLAALQARLTALFPGLEFAGAYAPPFHALTAIEEQDVRERIRSSSADIVFVGISTPKQEKWMARQKEALPGVIMIGVGAAFNFHAGQVKQAPSWMQNHGLEWLFRLSAEPRRLWRRYVLVTPRFLPYWALQRMGLVKF
jgi:N-acetylglucosaminyldiphosphoundecaprenol N-acetyl-beta-D-mannosaminyltransferase